jgi:hypothetical protein
MIMPALKCCPVLARSFSKNYLTIAHFGLLGGAIPEFWRRNSGILAAQFGKVTGLLAGVTGDLRLSVVQPVNDFESLDSGKLAQIICYQDCI